MMNLKYGHCGGCGVSLVTRVLLIVGGLNWGLVGLGMLLGNDLNLVNMLLGGVPTFEALVYLLVGVSAVMQIFGCRCKKCMDACANCSTCAVGDNTENKM